MSVYYTRERSRYGGVTGTIIPFPTTLPQGADPSAGDWKPLLPAGFLRCNGAILLAADFPVLASVLGTGDNSKFKKPGQTLANTQFQLPDLGSKYISASASSGTLLNAAVNNEDSNDTYRVGCEVNIVSLIGDQQTITYTGGFELVKPNNLEFIGNPFFTSLTEGGKTLNAFTGEQAFQAHGHDCNVGVFTYLGNWLDSIFIQQGGSAGCGNDGINEGSNNLELVSSPTGSSAVVQHSHFIDFPSVSQIKLQNDMRYNILEENNNPVVIDALGLETTVTITTSSIYKLDEATPPFILMEYVIKI